MSGLGSLRSIFSSWDMIPSSSQTTEQKLDTYIRLLIVVVIVLLIVYSRKDLIILIIGVIIILVIYKLNLPKTLEGYANLPMYQADSENFVIGNRMGPEIDINENGTIMGVTEGQNPMIPTEYPNCLKCKCGGCLGTFNNISDMGCSEISKCSNCPPCSCPGVEEIAGSILTSKFQAQSTYMRDLSDYQRGMTERFNARKAREFGRLSSNRLTNNNALNIN